MGSIACRRDISRLLLALGLTALAACASERGPSAEDGGARARAAHVGSVVVTVSDALPADRKDRLARVEGTSRLGRALESELARESRLDRDSPHVLEVQVTTFRLRSGAAVFWVGLLSGDSIGVQVTVRDGEQTLAQYQTGAGSTGAWVRLDQVSRFENLASAVAQRVVKAL